MKYNTINIDKQKCANWTGGTSQELVIEPKTSKFKDRDFHYRISIATVEISSSEFTKLIGYKRLLMVLQGELKLIHEGAHQSFLMPGSVDHFQGDWQTHSIGLSTNFNIIYKNHIHIELHRIKDDCIIEIKADKIVIYSILDGGFVNDVPIDTRSLIEIENPTKQLFLNLQNIEDCIVVEIFYANQD